MYSLTAWPYQKRLNEGLGLSCWNVAQVFSAHSLHPVLAALRVLAAAVSQAAALVLPLPLPARLRLEHSVQIHHNRLCGA